MVFSSLPSQVQEDKEEKTNEKPDEEYEPSEVPVEDVDSDMDMQEEENGKVEDEGEKGEEKKGEEKTGEDQADSVFDESQGNESYVPIEDRPKEFSEEEGVDEEKMSDVQKIPPDSLAGVVMVIEDSPAKAPGDESQMKEEDLARVSEMVSCHENIEDKISEITAKLNSAKKRYASKRLDLNYIQITINVVYRGLP